jgi:hypothetical protein
MAGENRMTSINIAPYDHADNLALRMRAFDQVDFTGRTVLDIGGYAGYAAALAMERGARKAVVVDVGEWQNYGGPYVQKPFPQNVTYIGCDMHQWDDQADITICGNVLYHDRNPWQFLSKLKALTKEKCIFWTRVFLDTEAPMWSIFSNYKDEAYRRADSFTYGYCTEYWECSVNGLLMLMERVGWTKVDTIGVVRPSGYQPTVMLIAYP